MSDSDCGHLALIASGEAQGLCPLCLRAEVERLNEDREKYFLENLEMKSEIERLTRLLDAFHDGVGVATEIERLRSLLFRLRNYIAGEHTSDRPKDAMLELIDAALEPKP